MSKSIRTVAVGLIIASFLIKDQTIPFIRFMSQTSHLFTFSDAVAAQSHLADNLFGLGDYLPAMYILACIGAGLLIASTVYAPLESGVLLIFDKISSELLPVSGHFLRKAGKTAKEVALQRKNQA
ncbi:hypothetical protein JKG47_11830 [Acidithiobacillus sp. MC6.1]|nr:hypothetical protein [Acidithiobacillus sp. MC6.1]